jgi:hypothetical protein
MAQINLFPVAAANQGQPGISKNLHSWMLPRRMGKIVVISLGVHLCV